MRYLDTTTTDNQPVVWDLEAREVAAYCSTPGQARSHAFDLNLAGGYDTL